VARRAALILVLFVPGCATLLGGCPAGLHSTPVAELIFGRNIHGGASVSDADWARFVDQEVTPRFPDGLSVLDVQGQWRAPNGTLVREPSKLLLIALPADDDGQTKLDAVRQAYKTRFHQESVMLIRSVACVGF
jgi:Protein of unknown function (DUF3574)